MLAGVEVLCGVLKKCDIIVFIKKKNSDDVELTTPVGGHLKVLTTSSYPFYGTILR